MEDIKHKIDPKQFGSLQGTSATFCLIDMINNWLSTLDTQSRYLRVCFVDFSKAFDHINHNILIKNCCLLASENLSFPGFEVFFPSAAKPLKLMVFCRNGSPLMVVSLRELNWGLFCSL